MRILRWIGIGLLGTLALLSAVALGARFADGPVAMFPGGELRSGEWAEASPADAERLRGLGTIELQLVEPPRSRTTWVLVHEGRIYVPCGLPTLLKQWPHQAMADGRAVIRFDGKRQRRQAVRVHDAGLRKALLDETSRKYSLPESDASNPDEAWFFRLDARSGGEAVEGSGG